MNQLQLPMNLEGDFRLRWANPQDDDQLVKLAFLVHDDNQESQPFIKTFVQDWVEGKFPLLKHQDMTVVEEISTGNIISSFFTFT